MSIFSPARHHRRGEQLGHAGHRGHEGGPDLQSERQPDAGDRLEEGGREKYPALSEGFKERRAGQER